MALYVTGDKHGTVEMDELLPFYYAVGKNLSEHDFLLIMGDFGLLFAPEPTQKELEWLQWLSSMPWTTLFIDGNHENFTRLDDLPTEKHFGNPVGVITDKIFHLKRGYVYTIENYACFTFGGALSIDRCFRRPGISWWEREIPSEEEMVRGWQSLEQVRWKVDYVFTHMAPFSVLLELLRAKYIGITLNPCHVPRDPVALYFDTLVPRLHFRQWYFGHLHVQTPPFSVGIEGEGVYQALYRLVITVEESLMSAEPLAVREHREESLSQILFKTKSLLSLIEHHGELLNAWLEFEQVLQGHDIMAFHTLIRRTALEEVEEAIESCKRKGYYHLLLVLKVEFKEMSC